jgi:hypothetical protein
MDGATVLVIVPKEYISKLTESPELNSVQLAENNTEAIFSVALKLATQPSAAAGP